MKMEWNVKPEAAFGKTLKKLRNKKKISQQTLAFESSLDRTFISLMERGLRQPSLTTILCLSNALGVSPVGIMKSVLNELNKK